MAQASYTYSGSEIKPFDGQYNSTELTISGTASAIVPGNYTVTFTPTSNYCWSDGTTAPKSFDWSIEPIKISAVPSQLGTLTYSGSSLTPQWSNYDNNKLIIGGKTSATDAGSYSATFTPAAGYAWSDGTTTTKTVSWSIGKAQGTLSISPTSLEFEDVGAANAKMITATTNVPGDVQATSGDTKVATVISSGKIITVTPIGDGSTNISVGTPVNGNYIGVSNVLCSAKVETIPASMKATASEFQSMIKAGKGPSTYSVGDLVRIPMDGHIQPYSWADELLLDFTGDQYAAILGFNHNQPIEGSGNYTDVEFFYDYDHTPRCANEYFNMNEMQENTGGPRESDMYKKWLPALFNIIAAPWKGVSIKTSKYVDCTGDGSNVAANVIAFASNMFLPAEFEVFGVRIYANQYEQNKQKQYDMYKNGAIKVRQGIFADWQGKIAVNKWWLSSPAVVSHYCIVDVNGAAFYSHVHNTYSIAPCIRIG